MHKGLSRSRCKRLRGPADYTSSAARTRNARDSPLRTCSDAGMLALLVQLAQTTVRALAIDLFDRMSVRAIHHNPPHFLIILRIFVAARILDGKRKRTTHMRLRSLNAASRDVAGDHTPPPTAFIARHQPVGNSAAYRASPFCDLPKTHNDPTSHAMHMYRMQTFTIPLYKHRCGDVHQLLIQDTPSPHIHCTNLEWVLQCLRALTTTLNLCEQKSCPHHACGSADFPRLLF